MSEAQLHLADSKNRQRCVSLDLTACRLTNERLEDPYPLSEIRTPCQRNLKRLERPPYLTMTSFCRKASPPKPFRKQSRTSTEHADRAFEAGLWPSQSQSLSQSRKTVFSDPFRKSSRRSSEDAGRSSEDASSPLESTSALENSYTHTHICVTEFVDTEERRKSELTAPPPRKWSIFAALRRRGTWPQRKGSVQKGKKATVGEESSGILESRRPTLVRRDANDNLERLPAMRVIPDVSRPDSRTAGHRWSYN